MRLRDIFDKWFPVVNTAGLMLIAFITLYPFWHELSLSFSSAEEATAGGFFIWPRGFTANAYVVVLKSHYLWTAYANSAFITVIGSTLSTLLTACTAYPLIKQGMPGKNLVTFLILFTMLFGGGIIPSYLLVKELGMINSLWALMIPSAISAYNVLVMRSFFQSLPTELEESATMDGASLLRIFVGIIIPLSLPALATIMLWEAVGQWNNFFNALIYLNDREKYTLPVLLRDVINGQQMAERSGQFSNTTTESVIAATVVLTLIPILCVYPFLQKHFTKGVLIGAVKM
ncbi:carbohydrate ABC transporter permease [Paenibacillus filicis]|uniref:Carbohydrate ABC transporter permease n=1 Tax=Paenibacillus gyeongsangnamensis TaxID=3388067 RepID=A0ABT4Q4B1_9BACL|nr:carbohydrate ABC transporter permease [Paenibacillus filicis]MCZ8511718.1 carbohydrate ABC transporter permease [Paenibacillus filicis]